MKLEATILRGRWVAMLTTGAALGAACSSTTGATDGGALPDVTAPRDLAVMDAPRDAVTEDFPDGRFIPDTMLADVSDDRPDALPTAPMCTAQPAAVECFTREALEQMLRFPGGGDIGDGGRPIDAGYAANGCLHREFASNSCCNQAQSAPWVDGDRCCYWFCPGACCGRGFTVDGRARVADAVARADWRDASPEGALDAVTARALAASWRRDALMEHASIASFARATLSLLALGAPPEILADTQRAALDEVDHARRSFSLVSRYAGAPEGPGALEMQGALGAVDHASFAVDTLREGCVGETLAAWVAAAQAARATDPMAREALAVIAADETRHAELAWRTVAWCVRAGGERVRRAVSDAVRAMADGGAMPGPFEDVPAGVSAAAWSAHGRLDAATAARVTREAWGALVAPCLRALVVDDGAARSASDGSAGAKDAVV